MGNAVREKNGRRWVSFLLAFVMVLQMLPAMVLQSEAGSLNYAKVPVSLADGEISDIKVIQQIQSAGNLDMFENGSGDGVDTVDGFVTTPAGWIEEIMLEFIDRGITYGVEKNGKYYIPSVNCITGRDALAATLMYYRGTNSNGYVAYRSASGTGHAKRQSTYDGAASYFNGGFSVDSRYRAFISDIQRRTQMTRYYAFLIIALGIEGESGGNIRLDMYNDTYVGYYRGSKRESNKLRNYEVIDSWWTNNPSDTRDIESQPGYIIQAVNLMVDICHMVGRGDAVGAPNNRCAGGEYISYMEFYKLLENIGDYSDTEPPVISDVTADLQLDNVTTYVNYKDVENDVPVEVSVRADTSGTNSALEADFEYEIWDEVGNEDSDRDSGTTYRAPKSTFIYRNGDELTSAGGRPYRHQDGLVYWNIDYQATLDAADETGTTDSASDDATITIRLENEKPDANVKVTTPSLPSAYQSWYMYVGKDINLKDLCSDYEDAIESIEYTVKYNGRIVASSTDFHVDKTDKKYLNSFTGTEGNHVLNFNTAGDYTLTVKVTDEMGSTDTYNKILTVTPEPTAPVAGIDGNAYTYRNYNSTFSDASTDANDDIVKWVWSGLEYFEEEVDEKGDGTGVGVWVQAMPGTHYTGTLSNGNRTTNGVKPNVSGTLQFKEYGKYRFGITVTDATGLTDTATHEVQVLEDIPVVVPGEDPKPPHEDTVYTVTFVNTDGIKSTVQVKAGNPVPAGNVPSITDVAGLTEHGWTLNGKGVVEPTETIVNGNLTFVVLTTAEDENKSVCTVTFINTDGSRTEVKVAKGGNVPASGVPDIVDMPLTAENGWTAGNGVLDPTKVTIEKDTIFWVDTSPEGAANHTVTFVNTDGTTVTIKVQDGETIRPDDVPAIKDLPAYTENGWTLNGETVVDPSTVQVDKDLVFWVDKDDVGFVAYHTVRFINSDGEQTTVLVEHGQSVPVDKIPAIKDLDKKQETGWLDVSGNPVEPDKAQITGDTVFWVDTVPTYTVTFTNSDGTVTTIEVALGQPIPADKVPDIVDLPGYTENGWTNDGKGVVDPSTIIVEGPMNFWVDKDPDSVKQTFTVTLINTDGEMTTVTVPDGEKLTEEQVPAIKDMDGMTENGWTSDGKHLVEPTVRPITGDTTFWVDVTPDKEAAYTVTFTNSDGTVVTIEVPAGQRIPSNKVPDIVDLPGYTEKGWTNDGKSSVDPTTIVVDRPMNFWVDKDKDETSDTHTVTFVNTDGTVVTVEVPNGSKVPGDKVPNIVDVPGVTENGWTTGDRVVNPSDVTITEDMVFFVDTTPEQKTYTVTFTNTDGTVVTVEVPAGQKIPADKIPGIVDLPGYTEHGWTLDGVNVVDPSNTVVDGPMNFWVDKDTDNGGKTHTVTFVNTDGTTVTVEVPEGGKVPGNLVPGIVDVPGVTENGWTTGNGVVDPSDVKITEDTVFFVDTTPEQKTYTVTFTNTDGTVVTVEVPAGQRIPADKVPDIIDLPGFVENGWVMEDNGIVDPSTVVVDEDLHFWVDTGKDLTGTKHTVTFVNTDGSVVTVEMLHGETVEPGNVPTIFDYPGYIEMGWTTDGKNLTDPTTTPVTGDVVYYVLKEPDNEPNPDEFDPYYDTEGRLVIKQNRAAYVTVKDSLSPPSDPIQWAVTDWEVIPLNGYDISNIKFADNGPFGDSVTFLAKQPGSFQIKVTLHNNYSDDLAGKYPDANKLQARTHTVTVIVTADEDPEAALFVNNANPDFHNYPTSIDVTVASTATSPDYDKIGKYDWKILRDTDNDGSFNDETKPVAELSGSDLPSVTFPVTFKSGVVGQFLATLTVTEEPGQPTISGFVTDKDKRTATATAQFEVNWTPCISYEFQLAGNQWAYVDDTIHISAVVKDENTSTCSVDWTLKKKVGTNYVEVADGLNSLCDVWSFDTMGGDIRITEDGYYVMEATITDDHGYKETFVSNEIRIYALPTAVIADVPAYRWPNQDSQWVYKQARKFILNGNSSYADDATGPAMHEIVHGMDVWSITPVGDGAAADAVYVLADDGTSRLQSDYAAYFGVGKNAFDEQIAIIEDGTYLVSYQVTNSYGKRSEVATQLITIAEDLDPEIIFREGNKQEMLGSEAADRWTTIGGMSVSVKSIDDDIIYSRYANEISKYITARYRYDSDNDGDWEDETWVDLPAQYADSTTIIETNNGLLIHDDSSMQSAEAMIKARVNQLGWYQFELQVHEKFGQETLPIVPDSVYKHFVYNNEVEVDNAAPNGTFNMLNKVYADIAFAFGGYEEGKRIVNQETVRTFGKNGTNFNELFGSTSITLQPDTYVIEAFGAQGGDWDAVDRNDPDPNAIIGGKGGYAKGTFTITTPTTLYINIGGQGSKGIGDNTAGYNGGGAVGETVILKEADGSAKIMAAGGGGATTVALAEGPLGTVDPSQLLLVAAGGGGATERESGAPANGEAAWYEPIREETNSEDQLSAGGGGGYYAGDAGATKKLEVSFYDKWDSKTLICTEEEHSHATSCYATEKVLTCVLNEHTHEDACMTTVIEYDCGLEEHKHSISCGFGIMCDKTEHTHDESCSPHPVEKATCGKTEHAHDDSCYTKRLVTECGLPEHTHTSSCRKGWDGEYICGYTEHQHTEDCYKVICGKDVHSHGVDCYKYIQHVGGPGRGGYSYVNSTKLDDTVVEDGLDIHGREENGYVRITSYEEVESSYTSSEYNDELLKKNANFGNTFGEVPGADMFVMNVSTVETSTISTKNASASEILRTWTNYPGSHLGSSAYEAGWTADASGRLYTTQNVGWTGFLYNGNGAESINDAVYEFTIDLSTNGHHQDPQGWTFNTTKKANGHYSFYALEIEQDRSRFNLVCITDWDPSARPQPHGGPVYHNVISGADGDYHADGTNAGSRGAQGYVIKSVNVGYSSSSQFRVKIERAGSKIDVYYNDTLVMSENDSTLSEGTFGPYTCSQWNIYFKDIVVETGNKRTLADALTDASFDVGHEKFVIWAEGSTPIELDKTSPTYEEDYLELIQKLLDSNIHLIVFGSRSNQSIMEDLLSKVSVKGTFINTGTVDGDLAAARDFIAAILRKRLDTDVKYVLVNEDSVYEKHYSDYNGHDHWLATGTGDNIYSSRWWYMQDPDYFANSLGTIDQDKTWLADEITRFDKVGRFFVDYRVKDNAVPDAYLDDNTTANPFDGSPDRHLTDEELEEELRHGYRYWSSNYAGVDAVGSGYIYDHDQNVYKDRLTTTLYNSDGEISNQPAEIFVHRRPIAETIGNATVNASSVLTSINIADAAYDIDHNDPTHPSWTPTKGLQQYEWSYYWYEGSTLKNSDKKLFLNADDGVTWINKMVSQYGYTANTDIKVLYRVRDIDGTETTETTTYDLTLRGILYAAPDLNDCADMTPSERRTASSYRYAVTNEDIPGVPAGTYVTQDYNEAIYVLKVDEEHKLERYEKAAETYNEAVQVREQKEAVALEKDAAAQAAEASRDTQKAVVDNWQNTLNAKTQAKKDAEALMAQYRTDLANAESDLTAKETALVNATTTYQTAKSAYDNAVNAVAGLQTQLTALNSELGTLNDELSTLNKELAALQAATPVDVEAIAAKQAEITAKESAITAKQGEIAAKEAEIATKQAEMEPLKTAMDAAKTAMDSAKTDRDNAIATRDAAQQKANSQQAVVDQCGKDEDSAKAQYEAELAIYNRLKDEAAEARRLSDIAAAELSAAKTDEASKKTAMDNAKSAYDTAKAKREAVRPLTMNAEVTTTQTKDLTIPDGVWSVLETREYSSRPLKPIARFVTDAITYAPGQKINITESSYSPNGNNIAKYVWTISRDGTDIGTRTYTSNYTDRDVSNWVFSVIDSKQLDTDPAKNKYKITLVVTDDKVKPLESDPYSVTITISPENQAPTVTPDSGSTNFYKSDAPIVFEYDPYDANLDNPYYTYGGAAQKRGLEQFDWRLVIDDPDNHDKYGPANNSDSFQVDYQFERLLVSSISKALPSLFSGDYTTWGPFKVTIAQALNNASVAPFTTTRDSGLDWGAYRITTTVTDIPNNGTTGKSVSIVTNNETKPLHLYVIPRLEVFNPHYEWEGLLDPEEQIPVGDTVYITVDSNEETVGMDIRMPDGLGGEVVTKATLTGTTTNADGSVTKHWGANVTIPDTIEEDDLAGGKGYTYYYEAWTDYGQDSGERTRTKVLAHGMNVLAIKLYDFAITDISDPAVDTTGVRETVPFLAFDELSATELTKLGYSFYFELYSMGLKKDNDTVRIRPHFYGYDDITMKFTKELDVYYKNDDGEYVLATTDPAGSRADGDTLVITSSGTNGHDLGYINQIILGKEDKTLSGSTQYWSGRYGLPSSAVFVKDGAALRESNLYEGQVLVMFEIVALKGGTPKYDYVARGQWADERQAQIDLNNQTAIQKEALYGRYESDYGSVIILDGTSSAIDNYNARPVWRSTGK